MEKERWKSGDTALRETVRKQNNLPSPHLHPDLRASAPCSVLTGSAPWPESKNKPELLNVHASWWGVLAPLELIHSDSLLPL